MQNSIIDEILRVEDEARKIGEKAKADAESILSKAGDEAREKADAIIENAKKDAEERVKKAEDDMKAELSTVSTESEITLSEEAEKVWKRALERSVRRVLEV